MELRQLRHLVAIADTGSFARAAQATHISQPAISSSIAHLEASAGGPLFERGAFGARLTPLGVELIDRARLILAEVERAQGELRAITAGAGGTVTVGVGPLFEHTVMPDVLAAFVARRPRVQVVTLTGVTSELHDRVVEGEIDFAISSPPNHGEARKGIALELIERTHDVVLGADDHPIWAAPELSLAELSRHRWIISARVTGLSRAFFAAFAAAGYAPPTTIVRTDSVPILRNLVTQQQFLCVASSHLVAHWNKEGQGQLRSARIDAFAFPRSLCLATREGALLTPAAVDLMDCTRRACTAVLQR